jgi:hypothetical protein
MNGARILDTGQPVTEDLCRQPADDRCIEINP